jgi:hypothetical protein
MVALLPGGIPFRKASGSERTFFRKRRDVTGMATVDKAVILNPFVRLSVHAMRSVLINEAARVFMRTHRIQPNFQITDEQAARFKGYGTDQDVRETIAARIVAGDPSAGNPTEPQTCFARRLSRLMAMETVQRKKRSTGHVLFPLFLRFHNLR